MMSERGLYLDGVSFSYGAIDCLRDISLLLEPGHFYGLIGPNGSGKSTLLDLLSGYLQPRQGSVRLDGKPLPSHPRADLARVLTVVPQSPAFNFDFNVYDTVMMGRHPHIPRFSQPSRNDRRRVDEALAGMGLEHLADRSIRRLSGGERQRVMIARALAQQTDYLLLDEGTANLDINHALNIMRTMRALVAGGRTVIAAIHDLSMALNFCDRAIVLAQGRLLRFGKAAETIEAAMIAEVYQVAAEIVPTADGGAHLFYQYR